MSSETIFLAGGEHIEAPLCIKCGGDLKGQSGNKERFTLQCRQCGQRMYVWMFAEVNVPQLHLWRTDCPEGVAFSEFARERVAAHVAQYAPKPNAAPG